MDEFIGIITQYTIIKPDTQAAREATSNGSLDYFEKTHPIIYQRLIELLYIDLLNPFKETNLSKKALAVYNKKKILWPDHDDYLESIMYQQMVEDFGYPHEISYDNDTSSSYEDINYYENDTDANKSE
jgi:hypothetical protein